MHRALPFLCALVVVCATEPSGLGLQPSVSAQALVSGDSRYVAIDLGTLGGIRSTASAINDAGVVVGAALTATGRTHAFLWEDGVMYDIDTFGSFLSSAAAVNNAGQVVGT